MNDRELRARVNKIKMRLWYWSKKNKLGRSGGYELENIIEQGIYGEL